VPAQVVDAFGKPAAGDLLVTTFRPSGPGPFPLVIISHGRNSEKRAEYKRQRYESAARYFVRKGFAVAVPLRLGYGELASAGDPESSMGCANPRFEPALAAAALQIVAVARRMVAQPDIDPGRVVLVGVSVGGIATIAASATHLPGQVAAINFAGGHGGDPERHPGEPCQAEQLRRLYAAYGAANGAMPTLWLYAENDRYFAPRHARRWAEAYQQAGGQVELLLLPPFGDDGHKMFTAGNDVWQPLVDSFLARQGFARPGVMPTPPATQFAALQDDNALPVHSESAREGFRKFLAAKPPRAFALGPGHWGYANGDDALSRSLGFCQRNSSQPCKLYAVDDSIVWSPP
jgi:dienelactone hydrolase